MQDVYELEEYHHDGRIGAFIKTRQCAEEFFDEVIEPRIKKARRQRRLLPPIPQVRGSEGGYSLKKSVGGTNHRFLLSLRQ
jgi:hypothetical protein